MAERVKLLGVSVDAVTPAIAQNKIREILESSSAPKSGPAFALAINPEKILALQKDPKLQAFFDSSELLIPDGIGVSLALRIFHGQQCGRVTGVDLLNQVLAEAERTSSPVFVLGSSEAVNAKACRVMMERHPDLRLNRANGYLSQELWEDLPVRIRAYGTKVIIVALGSPKQEEWMAANAAATGAWLVQGVGGSLDVMAGKVKRAPIWMRKLGLEWLGRLFRQPSRIKRQWRLPWFVLLAVTERVRQGARPWERRGQP